MNLDYFEPAQRGSVARSWHRPNPSNAWTSEILVVVTEAESSRALMEAIHEDSINDIY